MSGIEDVDKKLAAFVRYFAVRTMDDLPGKFGINQAATLSSNAKNWRKHTKKPVRPQPLWRKLLTDMLQEVSSNLKLDDFYECTYEVFISSVPSIKRIRLDPSSAKDERISIFIDPNHHSLDVEDEWYETRVIDQRFMYISRFAVTNWNKLTEYGNYDTYKHCRDILTNSLNDERLCHVDTLIILGAGSYSKDRDIVTRLSERRNGGTPLRIIIIDASFYMLIDTYSKMLQFVNVNGMNCLIEMYCFDFVDADAWESNITISKDEKAAYFLLGGTIGNLREANFFDVIRRRVDANDILCIAGEFFESSEDIAANREVILRRYDNEKAKDLALGAVHDLLNREGQPKSIDQRRDFVEVKLEDAGRLSPPLNSSVRGTMAVTFRTKGRIVTPARTFPEMALVTSKRYIKSELIDSLQAYCDLEAVAVYDHPTAKFSHLLLVKSAG